MNKRINVIIESYLESQNKVDYAIMIDGKWGSGKTYYVENELKNIILKSRMKYIYISLNGCNNFLRIINKITMSLLLKDESKIFDVDFLENLHNMGLGLSELNSKMKSLRIIYDSTKNILIKSITKKIISDKDPSKIVIIFDDIERISDHTLLVDIIGSIYENYTKKGYKTIFVGDETNINDNKYLSIKEKVIRRTILYKPDKDLQIKYFINNQYSKIKCNDYLDNNLDKIITYIVETKIDNLRTVAFIIDNFIFVFNNLNEEKRIKFGDFMFKNILILTNEYKNGRITIADLINKKDLLNYPNNYYMNNALRERGSDIEKNYIDDFHSRYSFIPGFEDIKLLGELINYILTGYLDIKKLEKEIEKMFYNEYISDAKKIFNLVIHNIHDFEEDELKKHIEEFIHYIKKGEYHIIDLPYIYTFLKHIQDSNYIANSPHNIEEIINVSLTEVVKNKDMIPEYIDPIYFNQKYDDTERNSIFYNELIKKINELSYNKRTSYEKEKIENKFQSVFSDDPSNLKKLYDNTSFFQDIVKAKIEYLFFDLTNKSIRILETYIYERFLRIANAGQVYYEEKKALEGIVEYIENNYSDYSEKHDHLRIVRFKELIKSMKGAIEHLEKTHRNNEGINDE